MRYNADSPAGSEWAGEIKGRRHVQTAEGRVFRGPDWKQLDQYSVYECDV